MLARGCQNLGRLNRKLSEVLLRYLSGVFFIIISDAHWASMNLAIVLCLKCAGKLTLNTL